MTNQEYILWVLYVFVQVCVCVRAHTRKKFCVHPWEEWCEWKELDSDSFGMAKLPFSPFWWPSRFLAESPECRASPCAGWSLKTWRQDLQVPCGERWIQMLPWRKTSEEHVCGYLDGLGTRPEQENDVTKLRKSLLQPPPFNRIEAWAET